MTTLIERLRYFGSQLCHEAADALERLTAKLDGATVAHAAELADMRAERDKALADRDALQERLTLAETVRAAQVEGLTKGLDARRIVDEMDAVAIKHAHRMALDLECILSEYGGSWYVTAMQTLGEYRMAMSAIHERESPTHMGEPVVARKAAP